MGSFCCKDDAVVEKKRTRFDNIYRGDSYSVYNPYVYQDDTNYQHNHIHHHHNDTGTTHHDINPSCDYGTTHDSNSSHHS